MTESDSISDLLAIELGELEMLWGEIQDEWNDRVADDFNAHVIEPFQCTTSDLQRTLAEHSSLPT